MAFAGNPPDRPTNGDPLPSKIGKEHVWEVGEKLYGLPLESQGLYVPMSNASNQPIPPGTWDLWGGPREINFTSSSAYFPKRFLGGCARQWMGAAACMLLLRAATRPFVPPLVARVR